MDARQGSATWGWWIGLGFGFLIGWFAKGSWIVPVLVLCGCGGFVYYVMQCITRNADAEAEKWRIEALESIEREVRREQGRADG